MHALGRTVNAAVSFVFEIQRDNSLKVLSPLQASVTHKKFQKGGYILSRLIFPILPSSNPSQKFHVTCVKKLTGLLHQSKDGKPQNES